VDHVVTSAFNDSESARVIDGENIPAGWMGLDIGPKTSQRFAEALAGMEVIFWNGPMGVFENPTFATGTFDLAKAISESKAKKMAGGGDVVAALEACGRAESFDFISTGGGATLEYLEGKDLPGLKALETLVRGSNE
jgi:phosphoglycerate kinase